MSNDYPWVGKVWDYSLYRCPLDGGELAYQSSCGDGDDLCDCDDEWLCATCDYAFAWPCSAHGGHDVRIDGRLILDAVTISTRQRSESGIPGIPVNRRSWWVYDDDPAYIVPVLRARDES